MFSKLIWSKGALVCLLRKNDLRFFPFCFCHWFASFLWPKRWGKIWKADLAISCDTHTHIVLYFLKLFGVCLPLGRGHCLSRGTLKRVTTEFVFQLIITLLKCVQTEPIFAFVPTIASETLFALTKASFAMVFLCYWFSLYQDDVLNAVE